MRDQRGQRSPWRPIGLRQQFKLRRSAHGARVSRAIPCNAASRPARTGEPQERARSPLHRAIRYPDCRRMPEGTGCTQPFYAQIDRQFQRLRALAADVARGAKAFAELVQSPQFHEFMVNGIAPDGQIHWPLTGIVSALRQAFREGAIDGWVSLDTAVRWVAEHHPEQTPRSTAVPDGGTSFTNLVSSNCATSCTTASSGLGSASGQIRLASQAPPLVIAAIRFRLPSAVAFAAPCVSYSRF